MNDPNPTPRPTPGRPSFGLLLALLFFLPWRIAFAAAGEIAVEIVSAETRRPLAGIEVTVTPREGEPVSVVTSADGSVLIPALEIGLYELSAEGPGLVKGREPSVRVSSRKTTPVQMALRERQTAIEEIVVVERAQVADAFGAASSTRLNREELRSAIGAGSDVMRALDGLPGLVSTGDFANFTVRGRGPRDNLIFVDGMPFDKVVHFDQTLGEEEDIGGGGRFSIFAPNSIKSAEFSPGGWSAAYGGRTGSLLQLDVVGGSPSPTAVLRIDIAGIEAGYDGPSGFHDDTTLFLTARSFDFGRVFEFIDEEDIGSPTLEDFIIKTVTEVNANNSVEVLGIWAPEEYTRDIDNVLASENFEDVALLRSEQDLGLLGITWRRLVGESGEWTNRFYYRESDKLSSEGEAFPDLVPEDTPPEDIPVNEEIITIGEQERELGWRSDFNTRNRFGGFSAGLRAVQLDVEYFTNLREDWTRFVYETDDPRPPGQDFIVLTPENVNSAFDASETNFTAYAEQTFEYDNWDWRAGLRYDRDGFSDESLVSPRLAVNYRATQDLRFSATAGVFYQQPRFLERAANSSNFSLENEQVTHVSVGLQQDFGDNYSLLVEPYYQQLDNLVVAEGRTSGRAGNAGEGTNYGVDVVVTRAFDNGWFANATYSYNDAQLNDNDGAGDYQADFSRTHFFSVGGVWEINDRWQIGARWKWASGRPTDDFIVNEDVLGPGQPLRFSKELTRNNALNLENYHSLNMRVDYRRPIGPLDLIMFVDVINVYGGPGANSQEFNPRAGVNVVEENSAFPIIGLIFERSW
ncbi:MAG: TonB-dependent receptor [Pseudomonadota bacterium]